MTASCCLAWQPAAALACGGGGPLCVLRGAGVRRARSGGGRAGAHGAGRCVGAAESPGGDPACGAACCARLRCSGDAGGAGRARRPSPLRTRRQRVTCRTYCMRCTLQTDPLRSSTVHCAAALATHAAPAASASMCPALLGSGYWRSACKSSRRVGRSVHPQRVCSRLNVRQDIRDAILYTPVWQMPLQLLY